MKVFSVVVLVAACLFYVYADSSESSMATAEAACTAQYSQAQQNTNNQVTVQTSACLQTAAQQSNPNTPETLTQVQTVRSNLATLQSNLADCMQLTDNTAFVNCVANDNNANQHLLNNANMYAQDAEGQYNNASQQDQSDQKNCVNNVMSNAKQNLTNAANQYNNCLENALNMSQ